MTVDTGYQVNTAGLGTHAGTVHDQSVRVAAYPKAMRQLQCPSENLLGEHADVAAAYGSFLNAWVEEFELTSKALEETGVKLDASAEQYDRLDRLHAGDFDRAVR
ncbi:MAG: hypothetical protein GEV28_16760 [Actinophytocola sp.]|uniref:hypothetical protein n=1 Tax=Actinophytocola sp. TaxID=1872138 RepID=UPI0013235737|nr:hypothetical protein [Actinophytocola sp.]MPZ81947.1 hypothetical protein [Actinophytocola sp.]